MAASHADRALRGRNPEVIRMNDTSAGQEGRPRLLSVSKVSKYLGIKKKALYYLISKRLIPYLRIGKLVFFDRNDIEQWLSERRVSVNGVEGIVVQGPADHTDSSLHP
jgi:excisionase family DNA binding protein